MAEHTTGQNTNGADPDDPRELDELADRLEVALDRIVRHLDRSAPSSAVPDQRTTELARRLDGLIGRLRAALGDAGSGESGRPPE